jgi:centromere/kinetochore protein ZW10
MDMYTHTLLYFSGNLVDTILTLLLDPIMSSEAITDAASRFVHSLFLDAVKNCAEVFLVGKTASGDIGKQIDVADKYSMLIKKVHCIGQFMAMRLDDINRGLEEGLFRTVTGKELSHLIIATYDESAKRNALLKYLTSK